LGTLDCGCHERNAVGDAAENNKAVDAVGRVLRTGRWSGRRFVRLLESFVTPLAQLFLESRVFLGAM
jgi:hypothetical protein